MNLLKPLAAAALAFTAFTASAVTVYDVTLDFSTASNPNGVWTYGYTTTGFGGTVLPLNNTTPLAPGFQNWTLNGDVPAVYKTSLGMTGFHPGDGNVTAAYRFTVPTTGLYNVVGSFFAQDQTTSQVAVLVKNVQQGGLININSTTPIGLNLSGLSLTAGDFIDVEVGNGGNGKAFDSTGLTLQITAVPEPETAALMLAGLAAVGFVAKRRKG